MTYRDQFGEMPMLKHDKNPEQSAVINHIVGILACDTHRAVAVFDDLRKRRILVFDKVDRAWHGCDHRGPRHSDSDRINRLEIQLASLQRKHAKLLSAYRTHYHHFHDR
jgi:hypothetical protein